MDLLEEICNSYSAMLFKRICDELKSCTDTLEMSNQDIYSFVDYYKSYIRRMVNSRSHLNDVTERRLPTRTEHEVKVRRLREDIVAYEQRSAVQAEELHNSRLAAKLAVSLTGTKLDSLHGQYFGIISCQDSQKYKLVKYGEDDADLSDKLWSEVEQFSR